MSQDTFNIVIGATIGFVVSVATAIIGHILQQGRDRQTRKWALDDDRRNYRRVVLEQRVNQAEAYLASLMALTTEIYQRILAITQSATSEQSLERILEVQNPDEFLQRASTKPIENDHLRAVLFSLNSGVLLGHLHEIEKGLSAMLDTGSSIISRSRQGHLPDQEATQKEISRLYSKTQGVYAASLQELDRIQTGQE